MYFAIDDLYSVAGFCGFNNPELKNHFLFGLYEEMRGNCMLSTLKLDCLTAQEVGQELGGN